MSRITAERYHDFSCGHRVHGHEGKCALLHGHNYRATFICQASTTEAPLDTVGRVLDFSEIKARLCHWLEDNWDHRFLAWSRDTYMTSLCERIVTSDPAGEMLGESIVWVPFNPTAENMALFLLEYVGPQALQGTGIELVSVRVEETRKCSATAEVRQ